MTTGQKTNLVAYLSLAIVLILLVALFLDKITGSDLIAGLGGIGAFAGVMVALLTKDHSYEIEEKQSITGGTPNPKHEQH